MSQEVHGPGAITVALHTTGETLDVEPAGKPSSAAGKTVLGDYMKEVEKSSATKKPEEKR